MIARLLGRPRMWAFRQVNAARFGPILYRCGRWSYVSLATVEAYAGHNFTSAQLLAAGVRQSHEETRT
jgi:hypothetical protein